MTHWPPTQAEAWMREHPGRWLESVSGNLYSIVDGWKLYAIPAGTTVAIMVATRSGAPFRELEGVDFHPPREHYATEIAEIATELGFLAENIGAPGDPHDGLLRACDDLRALFRAAPEGS